MKHAVFFLLFFISFSCAAQNAVKLKFDKTFPTNQSVILYSYKKGGAHLLKTFSRGASDTLFLTDLKEAGLYTLTVMESMNSAAFMYNPNENMKLEITYAELLSGSITIKNSPENVCYSDLQKINTAYNHVLDSLHYYRMSIPVSLPDFYNKCASADSLFEAVAREKNARLTSLQFYYPRTFTAQHLVPFYLIPVASAEEKKSKQTPYGYIHANYFKYVKQQQEILRHPALYEFLNTYFTVYTENTTTGIKKSIDQVIKSFAKDTAIQNSVNRFLVQSFVDQQLYEYAWYTMAHAHERCEVPWIAAGQDFINNRNHVTKGNIVDDIVLNDIKGKPVSLNMTCKKSKQSMLIFWSPTCAKNDTLIQKALLIATKRKIQVFAVYLGDNKEEWETLVNKYGIKNWVHASELKPIEKSNLVHRFMVASTPTIFMLNQDREITGFTK